MKKSVLVLLTLPLLAAGSAMAISLGPHRGGALVGRPLDISVQAVLDAQDDPATLCIEADAFYADNKLDKSLVRVTTDKALFNPLDTTIRIRSSVPVDEPVVNLYVRVGCQQKTERRYVVLADLALEPAALPTPPNAAGLGASLPGQLATGGNSSIGGPARPSLILPSATVPTRANARPIAALTATQPASAISAKESVPTAKRDKRRVSDTGDSGRSTVGKARLKLEPLESSIERDPRLKSSTEMLSVPAAGEQQRSAAAALWRALTAQPQDVLRDAERLQSLENSLSTLREQSKNNKVVVSELNSQLVKTRSERYANWLVYALSLLLLLALATAIYVWRRRASLSDTQVNDLPWWRKSKPSDKGWAYDLPASNSATPNELEVEEKKPKSEKRQSPDKNQKKPALSSVWHGFGPERARVHRGKVSFWGGYGRLDAVSTVIAGF